ncbi:Stk1 family PASTA domain-containing Ser/Thr kinase [Oscillibacter valericigenes]|nr:Stk1 family PASTA domain-containing Ser/Thr kinase [Oscillibacter valericigenes]
MDQMIGRMLDNRYELLELIGSGGMAMVYKAKCHRLNRLVAVKVLKSDFASDADFRRRFYDESQAIAMLSHPNIVSVYDVSRSSPEYIVMELIDGITLKQYMERRGRLNWRESLHFITQIMKGLSHAHSRGIVHRDIKPQNIMVLRDGSVKVTDFGIACLSNSANTMTQEALGSVHYISPEQAKGNRPDARSDIYSAGVVLYEMLTGRLPFEGDNAVSVAIQHLSSVPLSPREIDPEVPEALEKICMKAMASDIDRRYPTADAMLTDLEEFRKNPDVDLDFTIEDLRRADTDEPTQYIPAVQAVSPHHDDEMPEESVGEVKMRRTLMTVGGIALAAVIVFALWNVIMGSFKKDPVQTEFTVPNLLGMTVEEAEADARVKGIFTITEMGSRASSEYAEGEIVEQSPTADNVVRSNREIQVFVSTGEKSAPMENIIGLEWRSAKIKLENLELNLEFNFKDEYSDSITSGCIIRTEPAAGETLRQGDVILLIRSKGPEPKPITVISFVTYELETAKEEAEALGLKVGAVKHTYSDAPAGVVVEQSIAKDTIVNTGTEIVFTVSDGPDPSLSGMEGMPPEAP